VERAAHNLAARGDSGPLEQRARPRQQPTGGATRERQEQDPLRRMPLCDQPRYACRQRRRLPASRTCQDQQRPLEGGCGRRSLLLVQLA
jgi:hypothetical protein